MNNVRDKKPISVLNNYQWYLKSDENKRCSSAILSRRASKNDNKPEAINLKRQLTKPFNGSREQSNITRRMKIRSSSSQYTKHNKNGITVVIMNLPNSNCKNNDHFTNSLLSVIDQVAFRPNYTAIIQTQSTTKTDEFLANSNELCQSQNKRSFKHSPKILASNGVSNPTHAKPRSMSSKPRSISAKPGMLTNNLLFLVASTILNTLSVPTQIQKNVSIGLELDTMKTNSKFKDTIMKIKGSKKFKLRLAKPLEITKLWVFIWHTLANHFYRKQEEQKQKEPKLIPVSKAPTFKKHLSKIKIDNLRQVTGKKMYERPLVLELDKDSFTETVRVICWLV